MNQENINWIPEYSVRNSNKAKYLRINICSKNGLEVVIPYKLKKFDIQKFLMEKKAWIQKHLSVILSSKEVIKEKVFLPTEINFLAINNQWSIEYVTTSSNRFTLTSYESRKRLIITGRVDQKEMVQDILVKWCKQQAKKYLTPWIKQLSEKSQLQCNKISIRGQKTRWGSCSKDNDINLNYKLLFLPNKLASHVLLHEMSHVKHKHHKISFWNLLKKIDPDCEINNSALKKANLTLPAWLL